MGKGKSDPLARPSGKKFNPNVSDENPVEFANSLIDSTQESENQNKKEAKPMEQEKVTVTKPEVSDKAKELAARMSELIAEGKTPEEAMAEILKQLPQTQTVAGRTILDAQGLIDRMKGENNIEALRKKIKIAYAKKSKSLGKPSEAKYEQEIKAGQQRLNELIAECDKFEGVERIYKYIEYGEAVGTVLQMILKDLESEADKVLEQIRTTTKTTVKNQKLMINSAPDTLALKVRDRLLTFGQEYLDLFLDRASRNDIRCITLNREYNYIAGMEAISKDLHTEAAGDTNNTEAQDGVGA
jgi:hypothetical protein